MNYIIDNVLNNLMECATHYYREGVLYIELDADNFMVNISYNDSEGLDECDVWTNGRKFDLTDIQEDKIRVKAMHLHQDELEKIAEFGIDITN